MLLPVLTFLLIPTLLFGCSGGEEDDFGRSINHGDDSKDTDTGPDSTAPVDTGPGWDTSLDNGGGGDDTFNAVWVRCEDGGQTWTFHAELNYAARHVDVQIDVGTKQYEQWYLRADSEERLVWEVTVPNGLSSNTCDEEIPLTWVATGATGWEVTYESLYTPP